jgi:two-component system, NtrC family, sensor histidine kinase GlrK
MKLGILSRLMVGYIVLIVFGAAMSAYAIYQLGKVNDVTYSILLIDNPLIDLQKTLSDALLSETRQEKKFLLLRDPSFYEGFHRSSDDFSRSMLKAQQLSAPAPPAMKKLIADINDLHEQYRARVSGEVELLRSAQPYAREKFNAEKEQLVADILDKLVQVRVLSQEDMLRKVRDLRASGSRARKVAIGISAVSLLVGVMLSVLITRSITLPLREMKKKTGEIAEGVFKPNLNLPSPPEIGELARAFNLMCAKLAEVDRMKSDFYALMSHELRTPLASIQEGTNLLLEGLGGDIGERQRKLLTIIAEESKRLIEQVNSLLDLSRMEAGMLTYSFTRTELGPLVTRAVNEIAPLAEAKKITIEQQVPPLPPVTIDGERILQVLRNLIGNAIKFTPVGGVICIVARSEGTTMRVEVRDTGPGIPKEDLTAIFDKYRQGLQPGAGSLKGSGLGLSIVNHIMQAHGGNVWAASEPGQGSIFTFVLPA